MGNAKWVLPAAALLLAAGCSARATPDALGEVSQATTGVAQPDHVMVVVMENTSYGALIGAADAPYINSLISQGASFSNAHAVSHPSEPNYLALFSGSTQGVTSDACPLSFGATANLGSELIAAGLTFTAYSEDLPSAGSTVCTSGGYARKHAPWVNFSNVPAASQQPFTAYPSGNYAALPTVSFVIPNLCDDMHDCSVQTGDTWLQNNIDGYVQWAKAHNSLLVLTWDEDDSSSSANQIATVFVGQMVRPGTYGESISHYSVLRTIEDMFGLAPTGDAASASPITDVWSSGVTSDFSLAISPSSVGLAQGSSAAATVSTAVVRGGAESVTLSASGLPAGVTAAFAPSSVASGGSSTVTLAASSSAAAGTYSVTVTGTAASGTHSVNLPLTVSAVTVDDFSIAASPVALSLAQGQSASANVTTAITSGTAQTVALSTSGLPAGVTATFSPTSVTSGASATLAFAAGSGAAAGTYAITVTGAGASVSHTTSLALTVTTATGGGGLANGGFEAGSLTGWTSTGSGSVVSSGAHGGTYAARVGSTSPTAGDSSIAQTFTAPAGVSTLSFWYQVVCPDTAQYDWATATLADTTAGTTATLLPHVCSNTGTWSQVSAPITPGHTYTLTLVSHDDDYAGDPTYTLYDDVALGTVAPPPPSSIVNGDFEAGSLGGWTSSGTTSVVSSGAHGGTYAARLGSTSPTNGDSSIAQTFTASAGSSRLSFWYEMTCPDTVQYDWATAALKDNTAGTTATVLGKVCATGGWTQVTAAVTAGHSYTLTLVSHDDDYQGDPTYTLYDDVTVQ